LKAVADPDRVRVHRVEWCKHCLASLAQIEADQVEKRQVFVLPPLRLEMI
jgi:hypothetical protein